MAMGPLEMVHRRHELGGIGKEFEARAVVQDSTRAPRCAIPSGGTAVIDPDRACADRTSQAASGRGIRSFLQRRRCLDPPPGAASSRGETRDAGALGKVAPAIKTPGTGTGFENSVPAGARAACADRIYHGLVSTG